MAGGLTHLSDSAKHLLDGGAVFTFLAVVVGWFPEIAAGLTVIWVVLRIRLVRLEHRVAEQQYQLNARKLRE